MANNINVKDASSVTKTVKTTENTSVHTPHHNLDVAASGFSADIGAVADSAVVTDTTGSLSGKLRGLVKWAFERTPASLGQKLVATSFAVVQPSDYTGHPITGGSESIGGVKHNGPFWTPIQKAANSTDISGGGSDLNITNTLLDSSKAIIIDDLLITVASDMVVTVKEVSGATLFIFHAKAAAPFYLQMRNGLRASTNKQVAISSATSGQVYSLVSYHEA